MGFERKLPFTLVLFLSGIHSTIFFFAEFAFPGWNLLIYAGCPGTCFFLVVINLYAGPTALEENEQELSEGEEKTKFYWL